MAGSKSAPQSLADRGRAAAADKATQTRAKIERAKRLITGEIEKNWGVYPYQGGRLTTAEVLRRAGLSETLLAKDRHRTLRDNVNSWVEKARESLAQGKTTLRKAVTERAAHAEDELTMVRQRFAEAELEYAERENDIARLETKCVELEEEVSRLQTKLQSIPGRTPDSSR